MMERLTLNRPRVTFARHGRTLERVRRVCVSIGVHVAAFGCVAAFGSVRHVAACAILYGTLRAIVPSR